jgi:hypothetical protein
MNRRIPRSPFAATLLAGVLAGPGVAAAFDHVVEVRLDATEVARLAMFRATATPFCPITVPCAEGECLVDALDFGAATYLRPARELTPVTPGDGQTYRAQVPQVVLGLTAGFKSPACVADPACADDAHTELHDYDLVFDVATAGEEVCLTLAGIEREAPPAALADALYGQLGRLCGAVPGANALDLLADGARLAGSAASLDPDATRLALRFHLDTGARSAGADWAEFLAGRLAPDDGAPFSTFVDAALLDAAAARSLESALTEGGLPPAVPVEAAYRAAPPDGASTEATTRVDFPAGLCTVDGRAAATSVLGALGAGLRFDGRHEVALAAFDEARCGASAAAALARLSTTTGAAHVAFAHRLAALGGLPDALAVADGCVPGAAAPGLSCELLPVAGEIFLGDDARAFLAFAPASITFDAAGLLFSGGLEAFGPWLERLEGVVETPVFQTVGACGAQTQDYVGGLALRGQGALCALSVAHDPLGVFTVTPEGRDATLSWRAGLTLGADPALRARYFAAPYPVTVTALTSAGARSFTAAAPLPSTGSTEEIANRIVAGIACRAPEVPPALPAGAYQASWMQNAPHTLRATFTTSRGTTQRPYGGFYGGVLTADRAPTLGRNGRFTYTGATFTLVGRFYTRLNNGTEVDAPVSASFVADGTGTTAADGEKRLTVRPRQTLTFTLPAEALPRGFVSATVPLTLAPANVRFVIPASPVAN